MTEYDYLIVGAGWYGAVCARELTNRGLRCMVIDRRNHIGGNAFTSNEGGIHVHKYGAHIFHTNDFELWNYVNKLGTFNNFVNSPLASANGKLYNLPFNMNTFYQVWGLRDPNAVKQKILSQQNKFSTPTNLEEQAISLVGSELYHLFIKGYSEKQWGKPCSELPPSIIKRIPVRFTFDNNYFNDTYQGIPENGYTKLFEQLLNGIEVRLEVDYQTLIKESPIDRFKKTIYTGPIDNFFDYRFGALEYRSLEFVHETKPIENYQGTAVINYTTREVPYTRTIEHRHFQKNLRANNTVVTHEYPTKYKPGAEAYYPINDVNNQHRFKKYQELAVRIPDIHFGGRLAEYRYYDMHQVIASALKFIRGLDEKLHL